MEPRSVAEVRELLGAEAVGMTDADVLALRDETYAFAQVLVGSYRSARRARVSEPPHRPVLVNAGATPSAAGAPESAPPSSSSSKGRV